MIKPVSSDNTEIVVLVKKGSNINQIGTALYEKGLIKSELAYKIYVKLNKPSEVQSGEYVFKKSMDVKSIMDILESGPNIAEITTNIQFTEGKNINWIAKTIADKTYYNKEEDVYNLLKDEEYIDSLIEKYWFLTDEIKNKDIYYPLEGYLYPDTYNVRKDWGVKPIFETMLKTMGEKLEPYKAQIEASNMTVHEYLSLASMVELEASNYADRENVASVIYNRLDKNMSLGIDVTTYYAFKVKLGERDLTKKELDTYNPYNTRGPQMQGKLPVGPIGMVSAESLKASFAHKKTDYLYYVSDKNEKMYFTTSQLEHENTISDLKNKGLWLTY
jgi:UPF0755 protein